MQYTTDDTDAVLQKGEHSCKAMALLREKSLPHNVVLWSQQ
jgi:hypothetical protein